MSKGNSRRALYKSLLCDVHKKDGYITREKMIAAFEYAYAERCNGKMEQYDGNKVAYKEWVKKSATKERQKLWDYETIDDEGTVEKVHTFGYDRDRDVYMYMCKLKNNDEVTIANRVVDYEDRQAQSFVNAVAIKKAGVASQAKRIEKKEKHDAWDASNPVLFFYDEVNGGSQDVR